MVATSFLKLQPFYFNKLLINNLYNIAVTIRAKGDMNDSY